MSTTSLRTFRLECCRAPLEGMLEPAWIHLSLLIAIRHFDASESLKSLLASAGFLGLLITPLSLSLLSRWRGPPTWMVAGLKCVSGAFIGTAIWADSLVGFVTAMVAARVLWVQSTPLMTHTFTANYHASDRGRRFSTALVLNAVGGVVLTVVGGQWLENDIGGYPLLMLWMVICAWGNAGLVRSLPPPPALSAPPRNPLAHLSLIWKDKLFGWMLLSWMILGLGNLITIPLRVEYLAAPQYGIELNNDTILILTFAVPVGARILFSHLWGRLFDLLNFVWWRIAVNVSFVASFLVFFHSRTLWGLTLGMLLLGFSMAGGFIGWQLWVTKLASPDKVSAYMSVHTFCTGLRGSLAPWMGYALVVGLGPSGVAWLSSAMVILSSLMLVGVISSPRWRTSSEETSDRTA